MAVYKLKWYSLKELTVDYTWSAQHISVCTADIVLLNRRDKSHTVRGNTEAGVTTGFYHYISMSNNLQMNQY